MSEHHNCDNPSDSLASAKGIVDALEGNLALVRIEVQGCGRCNEPGGCGGQSLTQALSGKKIYRVPNSINAQIGDRVVVMSPPDAIRQAAVVTYVFPLLLCVIFAWIGQSVVGKSDLAALVGAAFGLTLGWLNLKRQKSRLPAKDTGNPSTAPHLSIRFDRSI